MVRYNSLCRLDKHWYRKSPLVNVGLHYASLFTLPVELSAGFFCASLIYPLQSVEKSGDNVGIAWGEFVGKRLWHVFPWLQVISREAVGRRSLNQGFHWLFCIENPPVY